LKATWYKNDEAKHMVNQKMALQKSPAGRRGPFQRWVGLAIGFAALWLLAFVVLPLGQRLPFVAPWMKIVSEVDINTTAYWYTQSEETAEGAMLVKNKMEAMK
jgi:hypothetical protein